MLIKSAMSTGASQMENPVHQYAVPRSQPLQTVVFLLHLASMSLFVTVQAVILMYKHYANNNKGKKNQHNAVIVYL